MAKTNWQDPKTDEIISPHISGLQEAMGKLEESIGMESVAETDIPLSEVFISNDDRCRIYQAPLSKRNWLLSPTPVIKKNGAIITDDFEVEYGGGSVVFTTPILEDDILTADATYTVPIKDKQLSTEDFTTKKKEVLANLRNNIEITKSPIGFPNRTDSTFSFYKATRTFTIRPSNDNYIVLFKEKVFVKDSPESVVIPNTTGLYYIYFNQDGILSASTSFPGLQDMIYISYVYWNENQANASLQFGPGDERHGTVMDKATHERLHAIDWTQWVRGLQLYDYAMNNSDSNDALKVSITDGVIADEDLFHNISHFPTPSDFFEQILQDFALLPVIYRQGTNGEWRQDQATEYPFKNTDLGRINFNEFDVEWKQSQVPNDGFVAYYIVFSADVEQPIKIVQGQRVDTNLADAQAKNDDRDISWGNIPFQEFKVLYRLILQTSDSFTNDRKAMLVDVLDLRTARRSPGGGGIIPSAHSNLTGLGYEESGHTGFASASQLNQVVTSVYNTKVPPSDHLTTSAIIDNYYDNVSLDLPSGVKYKRMVSHGTSHPILGWSTYMLEGFKTNLLYETQLIRTSDPTGSKSFERSKSNGVWTSWKRIATTDKIDILCTPATGYKIITQRNYMINNIVYIDFEIAKTDDTPLPSSFNGATIPVGLSPISPRTSLSSVASTQSGTFYGGSNAFTSGRTIAIVGINTLATRAIVSGSYVL